MIVKSPLSPPPSLSYLSFPAPQTNTSHYMHLNLSSFPLKRPALLCSEHTGPWSTDRTRAEAWALFRRPLQTLINAFLLHQNVFQSAHFCPQPAPPLSWKPQYHRPGLLRGLQTSLPPHATPVGPFHSQVFKSLLLKPAALRISSKFFTCPRKFLCPDPGSPSSTCHFVGSLQVVRVRCSPLLSPQPGMPCSHLSSPGHVLGALHVPARSSCLRQPLTTPPTTKLGSIL